MPNTHPSRPSTRTVVVRQDLHLRIGEEALRLERLTGQRMSRQQILERALEQFFDLPEAARDQTLQASAAPYPVVAGAASPIGKAAI